MSSIWNPQDRYILSNMTSEKLYAKSPLTTGVSGTSAYIGLEPSATYNETVLFSTGTPVTAFTVTEPLSAFTHIIVEFRNNNYNQKCFGNLQGTHLSFGSVIFGQNAGDANRLQLAGGDYTTTDYISWTSNGGNQIYFGNTTTACGGAANKQMPILNVWGINRKEV